MTATLNKNLVIQTQPTRESFPGLQATHYTPTIKDSISWVMPVDSANMLSEDAKALLELYPTTCLYGKGEKEVPMFGITDKARFVVLTKPVKFKKNKVTNKISVASELGENEITLARIFVTLIVGDKIVLNEAGEPQIFTIKADSYKTDIVGSYKNQTQENGDRTLFLLNEALVKHYQLPRNSWATHLVSIDLQIVPCKRTGKNGQSSMSIRFRIEGNAKPLSDENQQLLFSFVSSDYFQDLAKNPFGDLSKGNVFDKVEGETMTDEEINKKFDEVKEANLKELNNDIPF
jgi:hypothetical protein